MLIPWNIDCKASTLRGVLKHAWLEKPILDKEPDTAAQLCAQPGGWGTLKTEFPVRLRQLRELTETMVEGFSPAQLVDRLGAFAAVSMPAREAMKKAVHEAYLESSGIRDLQPLLRSAADEIETAIRRFRETATDGQQEALRRAWQDVLASATKLHDILERLPKGIVLP